MYSTGILGETMASRSRCRLLRILSLSGEQICAAQIVPGLEQAEQEYFEPKWRSDNDFWMLSDWLELLAASDNPNAVSKTLEQLPRTTSKVAPAARFGRLRRSRIHGESASCFRRVGQDRANG